MQRPDCLAGHVRLELRNVVAKYLFERSHGFPGIKLNSGYRDYSRLSCGGGGTQLGPNARISAGMLTRLAANLICRPLYQVARQFALKSVHLESHGVAPRGGAGSRSSTNLPDLERLCGRKKLHRQVRRIVNVGDCARTCSPDNSTDQPAKLRFGNPIRASGAALNAFSIAHNDLAP